MTIRFLPNEFCNALTCYRSPRSLSRTELLQKGLWLHIKGGPQFTRFSKGVGIIKFIELQPYKRQQSARVASPTPYRSPFCKCFAFYLQNSSLSGAAGASRYVSWGDATMDAIAMISIYIFFITISSLPCFLVCFAARKFLSSRFDIKPKITAFSSIALALLTAYFLNFELEGGILSVPVAVIALSVAWSLVLLASFTSYKSLVRIFHAE